MFNEPASSFDDERRGFRGMRAFFNNILGRPAEESQSRIIREAVEAVMQVDNVSFAMNDDDDDNQVFFPGAADTKLIMSYRGRLKLDSELAYNRVDAAVADHDLLPIFRENVKENGQTSPEAPHVIHILQGRPQPRGGGKWLSLILFLLTVLSVLFVGSLMAINEIGQDEPFRAQRMMENPLAEIWRGWPYAFSILLILGAHELGHYFAARFHKTAASLPYFLPFPFGIFGTFGAAISLREPMRNRKVLFDIGAAGPLAGLVFAIPILFIGLATSPVGETTGGLVEGNSLMYAFAKFMVFGEFLPSDGQDVFVNQLAWAGWTGLLVTGLNLLPVGQLDGGHILYSLLGRYARVLFYPVAGTLLLLTLFVANELLIFVILVLLIGRVYAVPLDDITPLDSRRQALAIFSLIVFALVFVPKPLQQVGTGGMVPSPQETPEPGSMVMLPALLLSLWMLLPRLRLLRIRA